MSTQRYISTSFWDDPWISSLDPSEKFVYMYLMTNPLTNIAGVYEITIRRICFDTGYNDETIKKVLNRFQESKKAYRWNNYIILCSWPKHQKWESRSKIKDGIEKILSSFDLKLLEYLKSISYTYPIDNLYISNAYVPNYKDLDINKDLDIDKENIKKSEEFKLSSLLFTLHRDGIDSQYKKSESELIKWSSDIEKLNRIDGRSFEEIEKIIRWVKTPGNFWNSNIMSGKKLREKFPTLYSQLKTSGTTKNKPKSNHDRGDYNFEVKLT